MRRAHHIVCFIGVVGAYVSINAEPIGFHITASVDPQHIQVAFQITVDDSDAPGDQTERDLAIQQYEEAPRQVNNQIKHEAFAAYLVQREFVKAERLAEEMIVSDEISSREAAYYVLGVAKVCRGDYEAAVAAFRSAQPSYRQAACFRVYISCLILREPEEVEHLVKAMLKTNEANTSRVAADAILAYCHVAKDGEKVFDELLKRLDHRVLLSERYWHARQLYVPLCEKYGKSKEIDWLSQNLGPGKSTSE